LDYEKPTQVIIGRSEGITQKVNYVSAGSYHVLVTTAEGIVYGWGRSDKGQLGIGSKKSTIKEPTRIKSLLDKNIVMT